MKTRVCDICGKVIEGFSPYLELYKGHIITFNRYDKVDICAQCSREIGRLVREKRKESEQ